MHPDVSGWLAVLKAAIAANDEKAGIEAGLMLLGGALNDLRRIADALEVLATPKQGGAGASR